MAAAIARLERSLGYSAASITGGVGDVETRRNISFGSQNATAHSTHDVRYVSGQARAAYLFTRGNWYVKPLVDVNVTYLDREDLTESGGGAASLAVKASRSATGW